MRTYFLLIGLTLFLTACGAGGGGSNPSPDNSGNPSGGNGGGTTTGGDGNSAYYGFSTDSALTISNQSTPPTGGTQMTIANEVSFNLRNLNNRILDVTIFKPTCIVGLLTETYSLVLLDGSNSSPTVASVVVSANGITFQERGVLSGVSMYDYGSAVSISGTCSNGLLDLGSSGKIFSNGKIILWKTGLGDLYVGGRSSMIETVVANFQLRQFDKYEQIDNNSLNPSNALSTWTSGDVGQLTTDASASSSNSSFANSSGNTNVKGFGSNTPNARYAANGNGYSTSTTQHTRAWTGNSADVPFYGFGISNLGVNNKAISITVMRKSTPSIVIANNGTSVENIKGSGAILIHIQK